MRKIKFRAKTINDDYYKKGTWVYGSLLVFKGFSIFDSSFKNWVDVDGKTKGQYTGLKDNNGIEIYEGDIVKCYYDLYIVKFQNSSFQFCPICQTCRNKVAYIFSDGAVKSSCEVIGNIYDNPNLLQIKK